MVGVNGDSLNQNTKRFLNEIRPGGIILFRKNIINNEQLKIFTADLQSFSAIQLFLAIDQEGGTVTRLMTNPNQPSAHWLGLVRNTGLTYELGKSLADFLHSLGINMNLAPVLDIANDRKKTFLGSRSISSSPTVVAKIGFAFSKGLLDGGVLPTAKHFPGLGSVSEDLHKENAIHNSNISQMHNFDLLPFKKFSELKYSALMLSHATYPMISNSGLPATFSPEISKDLLRTNIGYKGLVITDDLMMDGAKSNMQFEERVVVALNSGADILLFAWSQKNQIRARNAIYSAIKNKKLSMAVLNDKVERIIAAKKFLSEMNSRKPADDSEDQLLNIITKLKSVRRTRSSKI